MTLKTKTAKTTNNKQYNKHMKEYKADMNNEYITKQHCTDKIMKIIKR